MPRPANALIFACSSCERSRSSECALLRTVGTDSGLRGPAIFTKNLVAVFVRRHRVAGAASIAVDIVGIAPDPHLCALEPFAVGLVVGIGAVQFEYAHLMAG